jgi:hypothetical protein
MKLQAALSVSAVALLVAVAACVGDDPAVGGANPTGTDGDGGQTEAGSGEGSTPQCDGNKIEACGASCAPCTAPKDGTAACTNKTCVQTCGGALTTLCGDTCNDTTSSATSCGSCGHSCEGGSCLAGACQPFPAATGLTAVTGIDISPSGLVIAADGNLTLCAGPGTCTPVTLKTIVAGKGNGDVAVAGTDVFFKTQEFDFENVSRCPVAGCPAAGPILVDQVANNVIGRIVAGPNNVAWSRAQSFYGPYTQQCALPACTTVTFLRPIPPDPASNPGREFTSPFVTMAAGPTKLLYATTIYNDGTTYLRSCAFGAPCGSPTKVDTGGFVSALTFYAGSFYGASAASGGGSVIWGATDAAPTARTALVSDVAGVADVAVDASGIYWVNGTSGKVLRCPKLTGCTGGGDLLASGQTGATRIRVDAKFIYWMTPTSVMKLAK